MPTNTSTVGLKGTTDSLVLVNLSQDTYTLDIAGEKGTSGAYHLEVYLPGDVDGDRKDSLSDGLTIRNILGAQVGSKNYQVSADGNLDGVINSADYGYWRGNYGDATTVNPLTLTASLSPAPNALPGGGFTTNNVSIQIAGTTIPGYTVTFVDNGVSAGTVTADPKTGAFTAPLTLASGANNLQADVSDSFGQ